ncbi:DUF5666 domain-containing protein [Leifsonia sp. NPDC056665]|uniref:DUF5666 domain-containing protein n=1 Tax=Leifsonia sp. NPDC056665 TaxID=3345901 RepID=UPI0036CE57E8
MNTNDAENDPANGPANDEAVTEPIERAGDGHPTEPLPWWVERPDAEDAGDTVPVPVAPVPVAATAHAAPTASVPPVAPASSAGQAVTDSMKSVDADRPSFFRRHAIGLSIAAAAVAIVVVAGGTAWGVSAAIAGGDSTAPAAMSTAAHAKKGAISAKQKRAHGTVGTVTAMSGGTWTIQSAAGATVTVTVDSTTAFGTAKKPDSASAFAIGDRVGVIGARSGDSVTATRIVHLGAGKHGMTASPAPTPNT